MPGICRADEIAEFTPSESWHGHNYGPDFGFANDPNGWRKKLLIANDCL